MAFGTTPPNGLFNQLVPGCLPGAHRYVSPHSRAPPWCVSSDDVRYLCTGKVRVELLKLPSSLIHCYIFSAAEEAVVSVAAIDFDEME